jgi:hypothetical protein
MLMVSHIGLSSLHLCMERCKVYRRQLERVPEPGMDDRPSEVQEQGQGERDKVDPPYLRPTELLSTQGPLRFNLTPLRLHLSSRPIPLTNLSVPSPNGVKLDLSSLRPHRNKLDLNPRRQKYPLPGLHRPTRVQPDERHSIKVRNSPRPFPPQVVDLKKIGKRKLKLSKRNDQRAKRML